MTRKQEKEFKRRVGKIAKHIEALRTIILSERERNVLDSMEAATTFLRENEPQAKGEATILGA